MSLAISIQFLLLYYSLFLFTFTSSFPFVQHTQCHEDESYALLQFKEGFAINNSASHYPMSYPKVSSWNATTDCCSWDGIECDESTGHVIGIVLNSSQLYGSVDDNSTLFSLVHLQSLNLGDNDFTYSQIPSKIGELSKLRYLNLSYANFFGEIPQQISHLSNLLSLDLCSTLVYSFTPINLLSFQISTLKSLIQNSTSLGRLRLNHVTISSPVPDIFTNLTSLQHLDLFHCELYGEFPAAIFHLPKLRFIDLGFNQNLRGKFPDFQSGPLISTLHLTYTGFYGTLPASIGNLKSLKWLALEQCNFSGSIPSSFGNLTQLTVLDLSFNKFHGHLSSFRNLTQLTVLDLAFNKFHGHLSSFMANLTKLNTLYVDGNEFTIGTTSWICKMSEINFLDLNLVNIGSEIPSCLVNLTQLSVLSLSNSNLSGEIPSWIMNLTNLYYLNVWENYLQGEIPDTLFKMDNLEVLVLSCNLLEGKLELEKLLKLKMLVYVDLSDNKLSLISKQNPSNVSLSQIQVLGLSSCNLVVFPNFFGDLGDLGHLGMDNNKVKSLPSWLWEKSGLQTLRITNNSLTGRLSPLICNLKILRHLDLSVNNLSGMIPSCFGSFSQSLEILNLQGNKLSGPIPQTYMITIALRMIDLSYNNLQGQLPRALVNCRMLEYLDVSHNHINDSFPFWLGALPELKVVALHDNHLYGSIWCPTTCSFPKLHIIDLSYNEFSGSLPLDMIQNWKSMKASNMIQLQYEQWAYKWIGRYSWCAECTGYSYAMSNKGRVMVYQNLQHFYNLIAIDFSSNRISGEIPEVMGDLTGLVLLNLSNNKLTGSIPSSLGKLSNLEALDLSLNSLSGKIPQQLTQLTFMSFFNVSFNNLSGPIPQNKQFATFQDSSFEGNQGLCGNQLMKKCEDHTKPSIAPPAYDGDQESNFFLEFEWSVVVIGYVGGLVAGVALGSTFSLEIFAFLQRVF